MEADIDLKDKKILYLLLENGRMANSRIASLIGVSKNTVAHRIEKMIERGIIREFLPTVNYDKLGLFSYDIFFKLRATEKQEKAITEYFSKHPYVVWGANLFGQWDIMCQLLSPNIEILEKTLKEILGFLGKRVEAYKVNPIVERFKIEHQLFEHFKEINYKHKEKITGRANLKLDKIDKKILFAMNNGYGRSSYFDIGQKVNVSMETVRNRVLSMQKKDIISHHMTFTRFAKLGFHEYVVFSTLRNLTHEREKELIKFIKNDKRVRIGFKSIGMFEVYFYVTVREPIEFQKFIREFKNNFFDIVLDTDYCVLTNEFKLDYFPKSLERL
jgi:DNA-binding Lrp family transcriptional regulator